MEPPLKLGIHEPCHENWQKMTPVAAGRFCSACQKKVVDFTTMSDAAMLDFFKQPDKGSVCGRFRTDQLQRPVRRNQQKLPWLRYFFQLVLPAFFLSVKATAQGKVACFKSYPVENDSSQQLRLTPLFYAGSTNSSTADIEMAAAKRDPSIIFRGQVTDPDGRPLSRVKMILSDSLHTSQTDEQGYFSFAISAGKPEVELWLTGIGLLESRQKLQVFPTAEPARIVMFPDINLQTMVLGMVAMYKEEPFSLLQPEPAKPVQKLRPGSVRIYPNPVASGGSVSLQFFGRQKGYYCLELWNLDGKALFSKKIWLDEGEQVIGFEIPPLAAGQYLIRIFHSETGEAVTLSLLVN